MSEYQHKPVQAKAAPTAGPAQDDRYGAGKVGSNMNARIIKVDIVGGKTRITIAQGTTHGAHAGMEGYITKPWTCPYAGTHARVAVPRVHVQRDRKACVEGPWCSE